MKKAVTLLLALCLAMALTVGALADAPAYSKPKYLSMGTATVGGGYYVVGLAMCDVLTKNFGVTATAQVTGGATENNTLIQEQEVDFALTQASMA